VQYHYTSLEREKKHTDLQLNRSQIQRHSRFQSRRRAPVSRSPWILTPEEASRTHPYPSCRCSFCSSLSVYISEQLPLVYFQLKKSLGQSLYPITLLNYDTLSPSARGAPIAWATFGKNYGADADVIQAQPNTSCRPGPDRPGPAQNEASIGAQAQLLWRSDRWDWTIVMIQCMCSGLRLPTTDLR
jgi:hypothetical protein